MDLLKPCTTVKSIIDWRFYALLFLLVALASCNRHADKALGKLTIDSLSVKEDIPLFEGPSAPVNRLTIKFIYPKTVDGDSMLLKNVQAEFVKAFFGPEYARLSPKEAFKSFHDKYKADYLRTASGYEKAKADGLPMESWGNTYQMMNNDTVASEKGILSFTTFVENFMGGAHGSHHTGYFNIDLKTGKLITESDIFKGDYKAELSKLIIAELLKDNKLSKPEELIEIGFFDLTDLTPNGNFLITKGGILYGFNEYEIAPYYMGLIKVFLPNEKIEHILRKK